MDGGACPLYGAAELEGQDAQYQTHYGDDQPHFAHNLESKRMLEDKNISDTVVVHRTLGRDINNYGNVLEMT